MVLNATDLGCFPLSSSKLLTKPLGKLLLYLAFFLPKDVNRGGHSQLSQDKHYLILPTLVTPSTPTAEEGAEWDRG